MLLLTSSSDVIRVTPGSAGSILVHASWVDNASGTITPGRTNTAAITGTGVTTVVAGPGSGQRNVKHLNIRNDHASVVTTILVEHYDGSTAETLFQVTLRPGQSLVFGADGHWRHYGSNGIQYPFTGGFATQAQMEAGTSVVTIITPGRMHFHPGHPKCFVKCGVTGNMLASYNMTSVSDTGTGQATANVANDFSSADWCCQVSVERTSTSLTVGASQQLAAIRNGGQAAGTLLMEAWDHTPTTANQADPTTWHMTGLGDL